MGYRANNRYRRETGLTRVAKKVREFNPFRNIPFTNIIPDYIISATQATPVQNNKLLRAVYDASQAAYGDGHDGKGTEGRRSLARLLEAGYVKDEELSSKYVSVFTGGVNGTIVAYKGSGPEDLPVNAKVSGGWSNTNH